MEFMDFVEEIKNKIKSYLSVEYADAQVRVEEHQKINSNYLGLSVITGNQGIAPTINLNQLYENYQNEPWMTMDSIMERIAEIIEEVPTQFDLSSITQYENAKDKLFIRVSSAERNEDMLKIVPHQLKEDLAITYHIAVSIDGEGMGSTTVTNDMLKAYGISAEQLHADAMENSQKMMPIHVAVMGSVIEQMLGIDSPDVLREAKPDNIVDTISEGVKANEPMVVVTNQQTMDGAGAIFYPEVMDQIGEAFKGDFFILPSSIHETLVIPDKGAFDYPSLKEMVKQVNASEVSPEERLADDVYHYDAKARVFERADKFADRMKEKAAQIGNAEKARKEQNMARPKPKKHDMEL